MFASSMRPADEEVRKSTKRVTKLLDEMEFKWTEDQKQAMKSKIGESMRMKLKRLDYKDALLRKCKEHDGPFTNVKELREFMGHTKYEQKIRSTLRQ